MHLTMFINSGTHFSLPKMNQQLLGLIIKCSLASHTHPGLQHYKIIVS